MYARGSHMSSILLLLNGTIENYDRNNYNCSTSPPQAVIIAFHIGRIISFVCVIFGIVGNIILITIILRSSFRYFPYGLLIMFISTFDIIRLTSTIFYYLLQAYIIPLTLNTVTAYVVLYRYPKIVTNWLKVLLAIERFLAIKYWIAHRYNINSNTAKIINRSRQRKILFFIIIILICSLISQHPNLISNRFISTRIRSNRLLIIAASNPYFYYGRQAFNSFIFTIISYIILDDLLPLMILIIFNSILLYELRRLPTVTIKKMTESIVILFFLTFFAIFVIPRSFLVIFNLYVNEKYINETVIAVLCHILQGIYVEFYTSLIFYILLFRF